MKLYVSISEQFLYLFYSLLSGFCFGLYYEAFRLVRLAIKHKSIVVFFEDLLFCISSSIIYMVFVFCAGGEIRWFSIFGVLLGFLIYFLSLGKLIFALSDKIIYLTKKIIKRTIKIIIYPLKILIKRVILLINNLILISHNKKVKKQTKKLKLKVIKLAKKGF